MIYSLVSNFVRNVPNVLNSSCLLLSTRAQIYCFSNSNHPKICLLDIAITSKRSKMSSEATSQENNDYLVISDDPEHVGSH